MIFDKIENRALYSEINARIKAALNYISSTNLDSIKLGKHIIDGDNIFALVNEYETKNDFRQSNLRAFSAAYRKSLLSRVGSHFKLDAGNKYWRYVYECKDEINKRYFSKI